MDKESETLDIKLQDNINVFLHHCFHLSILLTKKQMYPWFYESYWQLYANYRFDYMLSGMYVDSHLGLHLPNPDPYTSRENINRVRVFFVEFLQSTSKKFTIERVVGISEKEIVDFVIDSIDNGYYVHLQLDEHYLPGKKEYQLSHFIHSNLLYGYNNKDTFFFAAGFNNKLKFSKTTYSYNDIFSAYESTLRIVQEPALYSIVELWKPILSEESSNFNIHIALSKLKEYITPAYNIIDKMDGENSRRIGIDVYDYLLAEARNLSEGQSLLTYINMYLLFEHKKSIFERLHFMASLPEMPSSLRSLLEEYRDILNCCDIMRLKFLKWTYSSNTSIAKQIVSRLESVKEQEFDVLSRFHNRITAAL